MRDGSRPPGHRHESSRLIIVCAAIGALTAGMLIGGWGISFTIQQVRVTAQRATAALGLPLPMLLRTPKQGGFHQWPYTVSISESELEAWAVRDDTLSDLLNERARLVQVAVSEIGASQAGWTSQLAGVDSNLAAIAASADATSASTTADVGRMEQMLFQLVGEAMPGASLDSLGLDASTLSTLSARQDPDAVRAMLNEREADGSRDLNSLQSQAGALEATRDSMAREADETKSRLELQHETAIGNLDQKIAARFFELERLRAADPAASVASDEDWRTAPAAERHAEIIVRRVQGAPPAGTTGESGTDLAIVEPGDSDSLR